MSEPSRWIDRRTGELRTDPIHAAGFLDWCHNTASGRLLTTALLCRGPVSRLYGWWHRRSWTRRKIRPFAERLGIDLSECAADIDAFPSFAAFIARDIDLSRRPVDPRPDVCASPADCRVAAYPAVGLRDTLSLKGAPFDLRSLLRDDALTAAHDGGAVVVCRLYLGDYHHFHFPFDCVPGAPRSIPGTYFAVTPYARRWAVPWTSRNHRVVTVLESEALGRVSMVEVGAFTIGSIVESFEPGAAVRKGDRKGRFELGASVIVLLFAPGAFVPDDDLVAGTRRGHETYVRVGERIGRAARCSAARSSD